MIHCFWEVEVVVEHVQRQLHFCETQFFNKRFHALLKLLWKVFYRKERPGSHGGAGVMRIGCELFGLPRCCGDWSPWWTSAFPTCCTCRCSEEGSRTCFQLTWPPCWMSSTGRAAGSWMCIRSSLQLSLEETESRPIWYWRASRISRACDQLRDTGLAGCCWAVAWIIRITSKAVKRSGISNWCLIVVTGRNESGWVYV